MSCAAPLSTDRAVCAVCRISGVEASGHGQHGLELAAPAGRRVRVVHAGAAVAVPIPRVPQQAASAWAVLGFGAVDIPRTRSMETDPLPVRSAGVLPPPQDSDP